MRPPHETTAGSRRHTEGLECMHQQRVESASDHPITPGHPAVRHRGKIHTAAAATTSGSRGRVQMQSAGVLRLPVCASRSLSVPVSRGGSSAAPSSRLATRCALAGERDHWEGKRRRPTRRRRRKPTRATHADNTLALTQHSHSVAQAAGAGRKVHVWTMTGAREATARARFQGRSCDRGSQRATVKTSHRCCNGRRHARPALCCELGCRPIVQIREPLHRLQRRGSAPLACFGQAETLLYDCFIQKTCRWNSGDCVRVGGERRTERVAGPDVNTSTDRTTAVKTREKRVAMRGGESVVGVSLGNSDASDVNG
jgi:hypothetical protein